MFCNVARKEAHLGFKWRLESLSEKQSTPETPQCSCCLERRGNHPTALLIRLLHRDYSHLDQLLYSAKCHFTFSADSYTIGFICAAWLSFISLCDCSELIRRFCCFTDLVERIPVLIRLTVSTHRQEEQTVMQRRRSPLSERPPSHSCCHRLLVFAFFINKVLFLCSVEFPQLFQLLWSYLTFFSFSVKHILWEQDFYPGDCGSCLNYLLPNCFSGWLGNKCHE